MWLELGFLFPFSLDLNEVFLESVHMENVFRKTVVVFGLYI
jgi:hypothetical protein